MILARRIGAEDPNLCLRAAERPGTAFTGQSFASQLWREIKASEENV